MINYLKLEYRTTEEYKSNSSAVIVTDAEPHG